MPCNQCEAMPITFYQETKFSLFKLPHSIQNLKTHLRTFPWVSRISQSKFEANRSRDSFVMIGLTDIQTLYIQILAWEPRVAQVTKSYSRRLPALEQFYRETKFSLVKSTHATQNLYIIAQNIPVALLSSPIKI